MTTNWVIANSIMWITSAGAAAYTHPAVMLAPVIGTIAYVVGICITHNDS